MQFLTYMNLHESIMYVMIKMWIMLCFSWHFHVRHVFDGAPFFLSALPQARTVYLPIASFRCLHLSSGVISCKDEEMERMKLKFEPLLRVRRVVHALYAFSLHLTTSCGSSIINHPIVAGVNSSGSWNRTSSPGSYKQFLWTCTWTQAWLWCQETPWGYLLHW